MNINLSTPRSIIGPALGGALAQPCESYPSLFARNTIFARFPFLLPNLVCAVILAIGVTIGILFLEETHEEKKDRRDVGLEAGRWILKHFKRAEREFEMFDKAGYASLEVAETLLEDEQPPGYRTHDGSPRHPSSRAASPSVPHPQTHSRGVAAKGKARGVQKAFTKQVIVNIVGYGILA